MSAFMTSNEIISMITDMIVRWYEVGYDAFGYSFPDDLMYVLHCREYSKNEIFNTLARLNIASLMERYPDYYEDMIGDVKYVEGCDIWQKHEYDPEYGILKIQPWDYQFLKGLSCYLYQCSEGVCTELDLYKVLLRLQCNLACFIAENNEKFAEARWG